MPSPFAGRRFGRFRVIEPLGAGGMGQVYRARDEHLERDVAIKFLTSPSAEGGRGQMRREAHALSTLNHPNIATVHDLAQEDGVDFLVMECITGQTLAERLKAGPLAPGEAAGIARQIAGGLEEAHAHGIVHRDLKPGNVMVTARGQVKIVDFGVAWRPPDLTAVTATGLEPGPITGTLPYMAPEQINGDPPDRRSDIWSFGVLLFEMVTGTRPFDAANQLLTAERILNAAPPSPRSINPDVPPWLESLILRALEKPPGRRFQTMTEVGAALASEEASDGLSEATGVSGAPPPSATATPPRQSRGAAVVAAIAVAVTLLALAAGRWLPPFWPQAPPMLTVLVADTVNRTGEPAFDDMMAELLTTSLEQSRFLAIYPRARAAGVLQLMRRDPATPIDAAVGREIVNREGLSALVTSSVSRLGDAHVLVLGAEDAAGRRLGSSRQVIEKLADLPARIDDGVRELRAELGESATSIEANALPLADVTSASLEAVRFYTLGRQKLLAGDPKSAIVLFGNALESDPDFAMAHDYIGVAYTNLQDPARAEKHLARAAELVDRVPPAERHKILADYHMLRRNYEEACRHVQVLSELRPLDPTSFLSLGYCQALRLDFDSAVKETRRGFDMQPNGRARLNLARVLFLSGDARQALEQADELRRRQPGSLQANYVAAQSELALLQLDAAGRTYQSMVEMGGNAEVEGLLGLADLALATGRDADARERFEAARLAAGRQGNSLAAGRAAVALAELALASNRRADASALVEPLEKSANRVLRFLAGRTHARAGQPARAAGLMRETEPDEWPAADRALAALLRAEMALVRADAAAAVREAGAAWALEPSVLAREAQARASVLAGARDQAVRYYEDVLARKTERIDTYDAPGFHRVVDAEYRLGVLLDEMGAAERARAHFERFLTVRSAGGASGPREADARARLARRP